MVTEMGRGLGPAKATELAVGENATTMGVKALLLCLKA